MNKNEAVIAVSTIFQNAGEATRAIEIVLALESAYGDNTDFKFIFISHGSQFEEKVIKLGYKIYHANPRQSGIGIHQDLKMRSGELIGEEELAYELLKGEIEAYTEIKPDVVLYGFWPIAGIARRMMPEEIAGICFVPLPLTDDFLNCIEDIPEDIKLFAGLDKGLRKKIIKMTPNSIKKRLPILRHSNIQKAAKRCGWNGKPLINIFEMLRADLMLVNDFPHYYDCKFRDNVRFTGPLFSHESSLEKIPEDMNDFICASKNTLLLFCTLGSSGDKATLIEIVKVFTGLNNSGWNAIILVPPATCPINEVNKMVNNYSNIFCTDKFIPALEVNKQVDIVVCHGGQGTLQTAIASGTPIVGIAMQPEQQINLDRLVSYGMALRISKREWIAKNISEAINKVLCEDSYRAKAKELKEEMKKHNGRKACAENIYNFLLDKK